MQGLQGLGPRRAVFALLAGGLTLGLLALAWRVLAGGGWTAWEALILVCLTANAPWLGLSAATGLIGFAIRLFARDPIAAVLPALRHRCDLDASPIEARTVLAVCVRLEDMATVLPPLARLLRELHAADAGRFALGILSDTPCGSAAEAEAQAAAALAARLPPGTLLYRRRQENTGFKAGNLMEFLDQHAEEFDFALVLDADSTMSATAVRRLVRVMQADYRLAILQPTVAGCGAETSFARLFGFGHRHGARLWATGQAWWQGPEGPYWGHNALLRIAAFRRDARLPLLPDGSHILSHDHAEAALLHAAGWAVRVLPEDAGSFERHPPDLLALFSRDLRWAAGNLQYRHLLRRPDLGRLGRFQMVQAILHYALAPLWFALLPLAALNVVSGGGEDTSRGGLLALLVAGFVALNMPKLAGYAELLLRPGRAGRAALLRCMGQEIVLGLLLDSVAALERTSTMLQLMTTRPGNWAPQHRHARAITWPGASRRFGFHVVVGLAFGLCFSKGGDFALLTALPICAGLILAVPLAVVTAQTKSITDTKSVTEVDVR
ncbi:glucans biosynthesis glucosyltransferase MdoH [Dankookia rubra]|uniref:Glucans biosynthesis glucosyltransferase H n=1 Tax=Dankookia rubra TaxID=1442381 RepID=A0A4R5QCU9_9PROT|nr:glucans biosynthesis glucosyltransferase MdoH [Dankookia rubra]TDH60992.1 glucans biosynthesis glucosyltransferase MdoH [Dankookia rubra]